MASDSVRYCRIAIYWVEPHVFRESPSLVRSIDLIFSKGLVHYWIYAASSHGSMPLLGSRDASLLPGQNSVESVTRSALAIVARIRCHTDDADIPLEIGNFFENSRGRTAYTYAIAHDEWENNNVLEGMPADVQILNALPYGREYSKKQQDDGTTTWHLRRASVGQPIVNVTIRPVANSEGDSCGLVSDTNSLGQWPLIPEPYRAYWSFDRACTQLADSADAPGASRELYDRIESYVNDRSVPEDVRRGMGRLRFRVALMTDDPPRVSRSAMTLLEELCRDNSANVDQCLIELGSICGKIEKHYPDVAHELLRPLVAAMVQHTGQDTMQAFGRIMALIDANRWFTYGKLLLEEIRVRRLASEGTVQEMVAKLETTRVARTPLPPDPNEDPLSVRQYLAHLNADPLKGTLDVNDIRDIVNEGFARLYTQHGFRVKHGVVDDVMKAVCMIAGDGPFCGDRATLVESIEHFSYLYLVVRKATEPIDIVLATFLVLSFFDTSTAQDHDKLLSQYHHRSIEIHTRIAAMLAERGLDALVTAADVEAAQAHHEQIFERYVHDPLWPAFKFPLTGNEESRLANKLRLASSQLKSFLDDVCLKVKFGGFSTDLKTELMFRVSYVFEQLLAETAFLRKPPYPGVSCQYRGGNGFTVVITGALYREGNRPKEKFNAMKYFHLGHRLQDIMEHERELAISTRKQELNQ